MMGLRGCGLFLIIFIKNKLKFRLIVSIASIFRWRNNGKYFYPPSKVRRQLKLIPPQYFGLKRGFLALFTFFTNPANELAVTGANKFANTYVLTKNAFLLRLLQ
jgi:hypothetical protein